MTGYTLEKLRHIFNLVDKDPLGARHLLEEYEKRFATEPLFQGTVGGLMIDIGTALNDIALVERGIQATESLLTDCHIESRPRVLYNLANGYCSLHSIQRQQSGFEFNPTATPLVEAKRYYRDAVAGIHHLEPNLQTLLLVNYGNCLSALGRSVEAIREYASALRVSPDHPMALGNIGIELQHYAYICGDATLFEDASNLLKAALDGDRLERIGESLARQSFERALSHCETTVARLEAQNTLQVQTRPVQSKRLQAYIDFCTANELFLNLALKDRPIGRATEDTINFSITTALHDEKTFPRLARVVNEAKERYVTARLLLFEACQPSTDPFAYDKLTHYSDNLDYAVYGVRVGKIKSAFEAAFNILDKIAVFINRYLSLGMCDRDIYFTSFWCQKKKASPPGVRPEVVKCGNYHLFALFDVSRDLATGGDLERLHTIRRLSTHQYIVPHFETVQLLEEADGPDYHLGYRELFSRAIELMQLVRSSVIYLVAFIQQEEHKKHKDGKAVVPWLVPEHRHDLYRIGPLDAWL